MSQSSPDSRRPHRPSRRIASENGADKRRLNISQYIGSLHSLPESQKSQPQTKALIEWWDAQHESGGA